MAPSPIFVRIAQSAADDPDLLATIQEAYTEVGRNNLELLLQHHLKENGQETVEGCDIVSDFFMVFG